MRRTEDDAVSPPPPHRQPRLTPNDLIQPIPHRSSSFQTHSSSCSQSMNHSRMSALPPQTVPSAQARPFSISLASTPPRWSPTESTAHRSSQRRAVCDSTDPHHVYAGDIADVESGDEPEEISECLTGQNYRRGFASALFAPVVPRARPPDSPPVLCERPHLQLESFAGELAPAFDYPLSPLPEPVAVTPARCKSSISLATASSTRSHSPASLRQNPVRGSENMTLKLLHGNVKSDPSVSVQPQSVSSPSNSPLQEKLSLSTRQSPNSSPWTLEADIPPTKRVSHKKTASSASDSLGLALKGIHPAYHNFTRRHSTPLEERLTAHSPPTSPTSLPMPRSRRDGDRPTMSDRSPSAVQPSTDTFAVYLASGRRSSLPTPTDLPVSRPLSSVIAQKRPPESPSLLLPAPVRKRDRSVTLQLASNTFTTLRTSLSTSVLTRLGHGKGINAPPVPHPVRWNSIKAISISFTLGEERGRGANQFLLGLRSMQAGGSRPWDPRVEPATEGFPDVSSTHGKEDQAPSVAVVYAGGGRRLIFPERMLPVEIMACVLAGPDRSGLPVSSSRVAGPA